MMSIQSLHVTGRLRLQRIVYVKWPARELGSSAWRIGVTLTDYVTSVWRSRGFSPAADSGRRHVPPEGAAPYPRDADARPVVTKGRRRGISGFVAPPSPSGPLTRGGFPTLRAK